MSILMWLDAPEVATSMQAANNMALEVGRDDACSGTGELTICSPTATTKRVLFSAAEQFWKP
jgi:hypothetical protein